MPPRERGTPGSASGNVGDVGTHPVVDGEKPSQEGSPNVKLSPELQRAAKEMQRIAVRENTMSVLKAKIEKRIPEEGHAIAISFDVIKQDGEDRHELARLQLEAVTEAWKNEKDPLKKLDLFKQQTALKKEMKSLQEQIAQAETTIQEQKQASIDRALEVAQQIAKKPEETKFQGGGFTAEELSIENARIKFARGEGPDPDMQPQVKEGPSVDRRLTPEQGRVLAQQLNEKIKQEQMVVVSPQSSRDISAATAHSGEMPVAPSTQPQPKKRTMNPMSWF